MMIAKSMTYLLSLALVALAVREAIAPRTAAEQYGVPIPADAAPTPFLEVKANRDLVLGAILALTTFAEPRILAGALLVGTVSPLADAYTVARHGKPSGTIVHLSTAAYAIVAAILAAANR